MRAYQYDDKLFEAPKPILKTFNSLSRILLYSLGVFSLGVSVAPLLHHYYCTFELVSVLISSFGVTLGIFGGAGASCHLFRRDQILSYNKVFGGALLGLTYMQFLQLLIPFNDLSSLLLNANYYAGILFTMSLVGYDTML